MKIELDLENSEISVVIFYPNEKNFWLKKNGSCVVLPKHLYLEWMPLIFFTLLSAFFFFI